MRGIVPLQHGFRRRVGFLPVNAPVFQLIQRNVFAGDGAADVGAGRGHAKIAVEIFDLRFALAGRPNLLSTITVLVGPADCRPERLLKYRHDPASGKPVFGMDHAENKSETALKVSKKVALDLFDAEIGGSL